MIYISDYFHFECLFLLIFFISDIYGITCPVSVEQVDTKNKIASKLQECDATFLILMKDWQKDIDFELPKGITVIQDKIGSIIGRRKKRDIKDILAAYESRALQLESRDKESIANEFDRCLLCTEDKGKWRYYLCGPKPKSERLKPMGELLTLIPEPGKCNEKNIKEAENKPIRCCACGENKCSAKDPELGINASQFKSNMLLILMLLFIFAIFK